MSEIVGIVQKVLDPGGVFREEGVSTIVSPVVQQSPSTTVSSSNAETQSAISSAQSEVAKQALLRKKTSTIKTSGLGVASGILQTGKKTLLGG